MRVATVSKGRGAGCSICHSPKLFLSVKRCFLEFRAMQVSNISSVNAAIFSNIDTVVNSPTFGRVISVGTAMRSLAADREVQILMRKFTGRADRSRRKCEYPSFDSRLRIGRCHAVYWSHFLRTPSEYTFKTKTELVLRVNVTVRDKERESCLGSQARRFHHSRRQQTAAGGFARSRKTLTQCFRLRRPITLLRPSQRPKLRGCNTVS